jgi:hypothetical protein
MSLALASSQRMMVAAAAVASQPAGGSLMRWRATPAPMRRNYVVWTTRAGGSFEPHTSSSHDARAPAGVTPTLVRRRAMKPTRWSARGRGGGGIEGGEGERAVHTAAANTTYLSEMRIRDFALVHEQRVHLHPGLNIITGQSGSGKSVLLEVGLTRHFHHVSVVRQNTIQLMTGSVVSM